jgi:hypothetical protein
MNHPLLSAGACVCLALALCACAPRSELPSGELERLRAENARLAAENRRALEVAESFARLARECRP